MNILIACEESQRVCKAFRAKGHNAFSCDIIDNSGGADQWHIKGDVLPLLNGNCTFKTKNGDQYHIEGKWDLIIAFPPCTHLACSGQSWFTNGHKPLKLQREAIAFFYKFVLADCDKIAIENPVGIMSTCYKKPTQIIQPWMFGEEYTKTTCLWLKNLPCLKPTKIVGKGERVVFGSGRSMPKWYADAWGSKERSKIRSKTFEGIANAMADQWGMI